MHYGVQEIHGHPASLIYCKLFNWLSIYFGDIREADIFASINYRENLRVSLYKYQRLTMEALDMASLRF